MPNTDDNSVILAWFLQVEIGGSDNYLSMSCSIEESFKTLFSEKDKIRNKK